MKKPEIISLLLFFAAISTMIACILIGKGNLRKWLIVLFIILLFLSMKPSITSWKKTTKADIEKNRVARIIGYTFIVIALLIFLALLILTPIINGVTSDYIVGVAIFTFFVLVLLIAHFSSFGWMRTRMNWLTGNPDLYIWKEGKGKEKEYWAEDPTSGIYCHYSPSEKYFYLDRRMFLNPLRFEKEYEERKYQTQVRLQQTGIPMRAGLTDCNSATSYSVSFQISKRYAKKENVIRLRDVLIDLASDDYDKHLFNKFCYDDNIVYVETYHYSIIRMLIMSEGNDKPRFVYDKETVEEIPFEIEESIEKIGYDRFYDLLEPEDFIEQETFENLWAQHCPEVKKMEEKNT